MHASPISVCLALPRLDAEAGQTGDLALPGWRRPLGCLARPAQKRPPAPSACIRSVFTEQNRPLRRVTAGADLFARARTNFKSESLAGSLTHVTACK
jgi:hypothetical protein